jgi:hypothetical protein
MENHAMTGFFQSSPKCVYVITSYNQVIYKYVIYKYVQKKIKNRGKQWSCDFRLLNIQILRRV